MPFASDYPLLNIIWTMFVFFAFTLWIWLLIVVFSDLFRRHDLSGWGKAGWSLFIIVLPLLGVLVYMIADGKGMAERKAEDYQQAQAQFDQHIRSVSGGGGGGAAGEISQAKQLLDAGTITQAEFDQIKARALSNGVSSSSLAAS
ncbi:MAG: SHOCT domain-containing protein [Solirubrobacteraceae bacterium]